jgi:hypothetical protein
MKLAIPVPRQAAFAEVLHLIESARKQAYQGVNTVLIDLYWQVGEYISRKLETTEWGEGVVDQLARYLAQTQPSLRGFTRANLFRMRQFYEAYCGDKKVAPLVRQLSWTHHLVIMGQCKRAEEREYFPTQTGIPNRTTDRRRIASVIPAGAGIHSTGGRVNESVIPAKFVPECLNRGTGLHLSSRTCQDNRQSTSSPVCGMGRCTSA